MLNTPSAPWVFLRRIQTPLAAVFGLVFLLPCLSLGSDFELLKGAHDYEVRKTEADCLSLASMATESYGKSLQTVLQILRAEGDFEGYREVEQEQVRFRTAGTVPPKAEIAGRNPRLGKAIQDYHEAIRVTDRQRAERMEAQSRQYGVQLQTLLRNLMQQNRVAEAEAVAAELRSLHPVAVHAVPTNAPAPTAQP